MVPFQEKYQNIMVSVNDAMEHSNVSWFAKFLSIFWFLLSKYFFDRNIEHSINIFIFRLEVPVRSMNGKKETILPFDDENQNYSILSNLRSNHRFDIDHPPKLLICKKRPHTRLLPWHLDNSVAYYLFLMVYLRSFFALFFLCNVNHLLSWALKAVLLY